MFECQSYESAVNSKRVRWVQWWWRSYCSSENIFLSFWPETNTRICWWDLGNDWQRFQQSNPVHSQGHGYVKAGNAFTISHENIGKGSDLMTRHERQELIACCKAFSQTEVSPLTEHVLFSSNEGKNSTMIKWSTHRITVGLLCSYKIYQ